MANDLLSAPQDIITFNKTIGRGNGIETTFDLYLNDLSIEPNTVTVNAHLDGGVGDVTGTDDGTGNITGGGFNSSTINYITGALHLEFTQPVTDGRWITISYQGNAINKVLRLIDASELRIKNLGSNPVSAVWVYYSNDGKNWVHYNTVAIQVVPQGEVSIGTLGNCYVRINVEGTEPYVMLYY